MALVDHQPAVEAVDFVVAVVFWRMAMALGQQQAPVALIDLEKPAMPPHSKLTEVFDNLRAVRENVPPDDR